jgi:hypothetical protein
VAGEAHDHPNRMKDTLEAAAAGQCAHARR